MDKANLESARMQFARMTKVWATGADLDHAIMNEARLQSADLTGASMLRTGNQSVGAGTHHFATSARPARGEVWARYPYLPAK